MFCKIFKINLKADSLVTNYLLIAQILDAMGYIHGEGLMHRDLKVNLVMTRV